VRIRRRIQKGNPQKAKYYSREPLSAARERLHRAWAASECGPAAMIGTKWIFAGRQRPTRKGPSSTPPVLLGSPRRLARYRAAGDRTAWLGLAWLGFASPPDHPSAKRPPSSQPALREGYMELARCQRHAGQLDLRVVAERDERTPAGVRDLDLTRGEAVKHD